MDRLEILREEGFPVQRQTFDFLQQAYGSAIEHLCRIHGENLILHGVVQNGTTVSAGAVVINGELLPFEQSTIVGGQAQIAIVETTEPAIYESSELLPAYVTRVARMQVGGTIQLSSLRRIKAEPTGWVNCIASTDIFVVEPIQCRINEVGKMVFRGRFEIRNFAIMFLFRLPDGFIPTLAQGVPIMHGSTRIHLLVVDGTDNRVFVSSGASAVEMDVVYNLNKVQFDL